MLEYNEDSYYVETFRQLQDIFEQKAKWSDLAGDRSSQYKAEGWLRFLKAFETEGENVACVDLCRGHIDDFLFRLNAYLTIRAARDRDEGGKLQNPLEAAELVAENYLWQLIEGFERPSIDFLYHLVDRLGLFDEDR